VEDNHNFVRLSFKIKVIIDFSEHNSEISGNTVFLFRGCIEESLLQGFKKPWTVIG